VFREHVSRFPESACNPQPKSRGASAKLEGTTIWPRDRLHGNNNVLSARTKPLGGGCFA
jgi:hypothetical protein